MLLLCLSFVSGRGEPPPAGGAADGGSGTVTDGDTAPAASGTAAGRVLTLSVLGDSISTYDSISNGPAADTSNSTIRGNEAYYVDGFFGIRPSDTWWQRTADALGLELLVNNSWSGSCIFLPGGDSYSTGYGDRCVNLHDDTGENAGQEPDIIAVYLGSNDFFSYPGDWGSAEDADPDAFVKVQGGEAVFSRSPGTTAEACAVMLRRITDRYPNAQVYLFTLPHMVSELTDPEPFNELLRTLAGRYGAIVVDLYADSAITADPASLSLYYVDGQVHPSAQGMEAIADCFIAALKKNCPRLAAQRP